MTESDGDWLRRRIKEVTEFDYSALQNDLTVKPQEYDDREPRIEVKVWTRDTEITIQGYLDDLTLDRDYVDATLFGDTNKTYLVTGEKFIIHGRRAVWRKKESIDR